MESSKTNQNLIKKLSIIIFFTIFVITMFSKLHNTEFVFLAILALVIKAHYKLHSKPINFMLYLVSFLGFVLFFIEIKNITWNIEIFLSIGFYFYVSLIITALFVFVILQDNGLWDRVKETRKKIISYSFYFLFVFWGLFIYITKIFNSGIGTDEGNTLNFVKLITDGSQLYKDFWYREPLSAFLYWISNFYKLPFDQIYNLRIFVILIYTILIIVVFIFVKKIYDKQTALLTIILMGIFSPLFLKINWGLFNIVWFLCLVVLLFVLHKIYVGKINNLGLLLSGFLCGVSILNYKATQVFIILFLIILFQKYKKVTVGFLVYLFGAGLPVFIFYLYYGVQSGLFNIYNIIIGKTLVFIITLVLVVSIIYLIQSQDYRFLSIRKTIKSIDYIEAFSVISILLFFLISVKNIINGMNLWPFLVESGNVLIWLLVLNFLYFNSKYKYKYLKFVFLIIYTIVYLGIIIISYANPGYIKGIGLFVNIAFAIGPLLIIFAMPTLINAHKEKLQTSFIKIVLIVSNMYLLSVWIGSNFIHSRFKYVLMIIPFIFAILLSEISKKNYENVFVFFVLLFFLSGSSSLHLTREDHNDYVLYSKQTIDESISKLELAENDLIFTGDLYLSANVENENIFKGGTTWIFRNKNRTFPEYRSKIKMSISTSKNDYAQIIKQKTPKYIIGSSRATFNIFFDEKDKSNVSLSKVLKDDYTLMEKVKQISIYERR